MTKTQIAALNRFNDRGLYTPGFAQYRSEERMLDRMAVAGLVTRYRHGGFEITDAGRAALAKLVKLEAV